MSAPTPPAPAGVPRPVVATLLGLTLAYLAIEAGFNARLLDVLGTVEIDTLHIQAVAGLEAWGRYISALAVGLALATVHVGQYYRGVAPFPLGLMRRARDAGPWDHRLFAIAGAIILSAMLATYFGERAYEERSAEGAPAEELWWAHYGARTSDAVALGLSTILHDPAMRSQAEDSLRQNAAKKPREPLFGLADLQSADTKTYLAILTHSSQNYLRTQKLGDNGKRTLTAAEIERIVRESVRDVSTSMSPSQTRSAILVPVLRCMELIYDQAPPFDTEAPAFPLPPARCAVAASDIGTILAEHPELRRYDADRCFAMPDGSRRRFADFVSIRCLYESSIAQAREQAGRAADLYGSAYRAARTAAVARISADPALLRSEDSAAIGGVLATDIAASTPRLTAAARLALFDPARDPVPACGGMVKALLERFARTFDGESARRYLMREDVLHCERIQRLLAADPDTASSAAMAAYAPGFAAEVDRRLSEANLATPGTGAAIAARLPTTAAFAEEMIASAVAPVVSTADNVIAKQFGAVNARPGELPSVATVPDLATFFATPAISRMAVTLLQELADSAVLCVGLSAREGATHFTGALPDIASNWDGKFHRPAMQLIADRSLSTRLTGSVADFAEGGRCHAAGVAAQHRARVPGIALMISLLGLLYHSRKAALYGFALAGLGVIQRQLAALAVLVALCLAPLQVRSKVLDQPDLAKLIGAYADSRGPVFVDGAKWLIRMELLIYPATDTIYASLLRPWGIAFARPLDPVTLDAATQRIDRACGRVPQIAQSSEYKLVRSVLVNRSLCNVE